jgi:carbon-monoxide dehydrogenase iron sulfur subunit
LEEQKMTRVERRDAEPEKKPEQTPAETGGGGKISRREFLEMAGSGIVGLAIGGVVGSQAFPKKVEVQAPAPAPEAAPAAGGEVAPAAEAPKSGYTIVFDPYQCTGCMKCARACSEHWAAELFPEETKNMVNLEFSRIRPMRFQYVDVINICQDCKLVQWAEGSEKAPCEQVCPQAAISFIPEGQGKVGFTGMGYKTIDREACLGLDKCWRCAEICEDQFASGISFDPIEKKAQVCTRCGGDPQCVKACPEPLALQWVPVGRNGRFFAQHPSDFAELLYRKMYGARRTL